MDRLGRPTGTHDNSPAVLLLGTWSNSVFVSPVGTTEIVLSNAAFATSLRDAGGTAFSLFSAPRCWATVDRPVGTLSSPGNRACLRCWSTISRFFNSTIPALPSCERTTGTGLRRPPYHATSPMPLSRSGIGPVCSSFRNRLRAGGWLICCRVGIKLSGSMRRAGRGTSADYADSRQIGAVDA